MSWASETDVQLMLPGVTWCYNWGTEPKSNAASWLDNNGMEFIPMAWSGVNANALRTYYNAHPQEKYLLAFNEPNLTDQANMTPTSAAARWPNVTSLASELNLKVISPAMNYGTLSGYSDPITWLDEFFAKDNVSLDDVDGIAMHAYMASASAVISYLNRFTKYGKKLWLTEFCAWESSIGSAEKQMAYMSAMLNWLEKSSDVERYAWFIPRNGKPVNTYPYMVLLTNTKPAELTPAGKLYVYMSTFDQSVTYSANKRIPAEHYRDCSVDGDNSPIVSNSSDVDGILAISGFNKNMWADYRVNVSAGNATIRVRYASARNNVMSVYVDGTLLGQYDLPLTGDDAPWATLDLPQTNLTAGVHTIRLEMTKGSVALNWFKIIQ
ncbi:MAG: carbohydrate-binding protein [Paludibacteraceae bacterium]|nr:carbohydrate-binding protein [Paludibacteraceae bacterium]